jgi:hypothetical protein
MMHIDTIAIHIDPCRVIWILWMSADRQIRAGQSAYRQVGWTVTQVEQEMTHEELMALPVVVSLETANRALGIGRTNGYDMAKRNAYPVRVLRHGRRYTVSRYDLHRHLGVARDADVQGRSDAA